MIQDPRLLRPGRRLLFTGAVWAALALAVNLTGRPAVLLLGLIPLGIALRSVWLKRSQKRWDDPEARLGRAIRTAAVLMAAAILLATCWALRGNVPAWAWPLLAGALLHYWLLALGEAP